MRAFLACQRLRFRVALARSFRFDRSLAASTYHRESHRLFSGGINACLSTIDPTLSHSGCSFAIYANTWRLVLLGMALTTGSLSRTLGRLFIYATFSAAHPPLRVWDDYRVITTLISQRKSHRKRFDRGLSRIIGAFPPLKSSWRGRVCHSQRQLA